MRLLHYLDKNPRKREEIFRLIIRPDFMERVEEIRNKLGISTADLEVPSPENESEYLRFSESTATQNEAMRLIKEFKISKNWLDLLITYIVSNNFVPSNDMNPDGLILETDLEQDPSAPIKNYLLHITSETTLDDIKKAWPTIRKEMAQGKFHRKKPWETFWRDYEIYRLVNTGKSIAEIDKEIYKKFGEDLEYGHIKQIESEFRKEIGIPKRYRKQKLKTTNRK